MPEPAAIDFSEGQNSGLSQLSGLSPLLMNVLPDVAKAIRPWPGIAEWDQWAETADSDVIGIYPWRQYIIVVLADRTIWAWLGPDNVLALSDTSDTTTMLDGTGRPVFTFDQARVAIAGGGAPQKWEGVGLSERLAPGATAPDGSGLTLTHIAYAAQTFIGCLNNNSGIVQWTQPGQGNHGTWPVVGPYYAEAEAAPDPVVALFATANEVFAFGAQTTQVYQPDPVIGFAPGPTISTGCSAPFSVIQHEDGSFSWLDNNRRFVGSNGRDLDVISAPGMTADIKSLGTVSDCWGANIMIGSWDLDVWVFPAEGRTFWYDRITKKWGERSSCNANTGEFEGWIAKSYAYLESQNTHLIGLSGGRIGVLDFTHHTDDERPIRWASRTGFQNYGSYTRKVCQRVQVQVQRNAPGDTGASFELRYRDALGAWAPTITASLDAAGYETVVDMGWALGDFRARQWELRGSNEADYLIAGVTAELLPEDS